MAVDTQNKRRSVQAYGGNIVYPVADGTVDTADREHSAWLYSGIAAGAPLVSSGPRNQRIGLHIGVGLSLLAAVMNP